MQASQRPVSSSLPVNHWSLKQSMHPLQHRIPLCDEFYSATASSHSSASKEILFSPMWPEFATGHKHNTNRKYKSWCSEHLKKIIISQSYSQNLPNGEPMLRVSLTLTLIQFCLSFFFWLFQLEGILPHLFKLILIYTANPVETRWGCHSQSSPRSQQKRSLTNTQVLKFTTFVKTHSHNKRTHTHRHRARNKR